MKKNEKNEKNKCTNSETAMSAYSKKDNFKFLIKWFLIFNFKKNLYRLSKKVESL